jgi:hypothetical protein
VKLLAILIAACALSVQAAPAPPGQKVSYEAKAAFIKKCFRDRTKSACEAPPEARVRR